MSDPIYTAIANLKGPTGATGPQGLPGVNAVANDTATATYVGGPSETRTALETFFSEKSAGLSRLNGQIVLILDDGYSSANLIGIPAVEAVGGKLNLAIISDAMGSGQTRMRPQEVRDAHERGHQIICHSKTHADLTGLSPEDRLLEWESADALEAVTGVFPSSFVYPVSAANTQTGVEAYGRFDRALIGVAGQYMWPSGPGEHFMGRWSWSDGNHAATLSKVVEAAAGNYTLIMYTHQLDGSNLSNGVTEAEFLELVELAATLGMRFVTLDEAFTPVVGIRDASFENSDVTQNWAKSESGTGGAGTFASVTKTPDTNIAGARALQITRPSGTGFSHVFSLNRIRVVGGQSYTYSGRLKLEDKTTGSGGVQLRLYQFRLNGSGLSDKTSAYVSTNGGWQQMVLTTTLDADAAYVVPVVTHNVADGTSFADHLHFDLTANGIRG